MMEEDVIELIIEGRIASQSQDFKDAIKYYKKAIKKKKDCIVCWTEMGEAYVALGDFKKALQSFQEATELEPDNGKLWFNLGKAHVDCGFAQDSISILEGALELEPDLVGIWQELARAYLILKEPGKALEICKKSIELEWSRKGLELQLGAHFDLEKYEEFETQGKQLLEEFPLSGYTYLLLAILKIQQGNQEEALKCVRDMVEVTESQVELNRYLTDSRLSPLKSNPEFNRIVKETREKYIRCQEMLSKGLDGLEDFLWIEIGDRLLVDPNLIDSNLKILEEITGELPRFWEAWWYLGKAFQAFDIPVEIDGKHGAKLPVPERFDSAKQEAYRTFKAAYELHPGNPDVTIDFALAAVEVGRAQEAIEALTRGTKEFPKELSIISNLGLVYLISGNYDACVSTGEAALSLGPGYPITLLCLKVCEEVRKGILPQPKSMSEYRELARQIVLR